MKKTNLHTACLTASAMFLLAAASLPVQAQTGEGQFDLSPFVGEHKFENKQNLEDEFTYGLRLGYAITPNWSLEGAVSFVETHVDNALMTNPTEGQFASPIDDVDLLLYQIDALYHFRPQQKFQPYLVGGYGAADYSPSISDKHMSAFNLGAGAKYWFNDSVALRLDVRNHFVGELVQETYNNLSATIGLTFSFGSKAKTIVAPAQQTYVAPQPATPQPVAKEEVIVLEFEDIHFDFDQSTLTSEAKTILQRSVTTLKQNPKSKVRIAGYTSASGTAEYNQELSERRATAIKQYLVEQGIATRRLSTIGYGDNRPAAHEATPTNLNSNAAQKNMRALFEIIVE
jgi:OOP family OmpA-OmpF porin